MPELNTLHERLAAFAGEWEGTEELAASPWSPGGTAKAQMTFAVAAGGFALVQDYRSETGLTGHGVFSVADDVVLWHWFDSIGYPPRPRPAAASTATRSCSNAPPARDEPHDLHPRRRPTDPGSRSTGRPSVVEAYRQHQH